MRHAWWVRLGEVDEETLLGALAPAPQVHQRLVLEPRASAGRTARAEESASRVFWYGDRVAFRQGERLVNDTCEERKVMQG